MGCTKKRTLQVNMWDVLLLLVLIVIILYYAFKEFLDE